jgi:hypothetical protein
MRDGFKGLYWRWQAPLRYLATQRIKRSGLGKSSSKIERLKRAGLTTGGAA